MNCSRIQRQRVSVNVSRPAPFLGWNAKESLAEMDPRSAVVLDNWVPTTTDVRVRKGSINHTTGLTVPCETLMAWASGTLRKLWAAIGTGFFDVSVASVLPTATVTGLASARWQHTQFENNAGNHFLIACNGLDTPRIYNGTAWSAMTATGIASPNVFRAVTGFKNRLFFVEDQTLNVWYLPLSQITGAVAKINVGALAQRGGSVRAIFSIPTTAGNSPDDYFGVVTDQGELFIYQGTDPGVAGAWALVGSYQTGRPIGWRCATKWGDDVVLITDQGLVSMKRLIASKDGTTVAISDNIREAVANAVARNEQAFGWQAIPHTRERQLCLNVPSAPQQTGEQFVMYTDHGAWCRFTGWQAQCFEVVDGRLFYGSHSVIRECNTGRADADLLIEADGSTAYDYFDRRGATKHFKMIRPTFVADGSVDTSVTMGADFAAAPLALTLGITDGGGFAWDGFNWDAASWADPPKPTRIWRGAGVQGDCATIRVRVRTSAAEIRWMSTEVLFESGGIL